MFFRSLLVASTLLLLPARLAGQLTIPIYIEARIGLAVPTGEFGSAQEAPEAGPGPTFALGGRVDVTSRVGLYAAYQRTYFGCPACRNSDLDDSMILDGGEAGVRVDVPLQYSGISPWLSGGLLYQVLAFSNEGERMTSEPDVGYVGSVGASFPLWSRLEVQPSARYLSVPSRFTFGFAPDETIDVSGFTVDVGFAFRL